MRFDLTDEQAAIKETIDGILTERLTSERLEASARDGAMDADLWSELCGLGFAGLAISPDYGGQGLGLLELGIVCESAGAALAPVPLLPHAAAGLVVGAAAGEAEGAALLTELAVGDHPASVALLRDGRDPLTIDPDGDGPLIVVEDGRAGVADEAVVITPVPTIDLMRRYREVRGAPARSMPGEVGRAIDRIEVLLAAELTGVAQRALEIAVAYAGEREQFGRPIGSFQGVSHRCAQMLLEIESARSVWRFATWADIGAPDRFRLAASTAKAAAVTAADNATAGAIQVLGGIGFTWEHEIHRYLRRAKVARLVFGAASEHRRRIATELRRLDGEMEGGRNGEIGREKEMADGLT